MKPFALFSKEEKLKKDIPLSEHFDPYYHSRDVYIAADHCVLQWAALPGGPQGYWRIPVPSHIKTKEQLFAYLIEEHQFKLPPEAPVTPTPQPAAPADLERKLHKLYVCTRCQKAITDNETRWVDDQRYCRACGMAVAKPAPPIPHTPLVEVNTQEMNEERHTAAIAPPPSGVSAAEKERILRELRQQIIAAIAKQPSTTYQLASLLWNDAANCFPTNYSFNWDGAWFKLNLENGRLYADVSTYPNQFGAAREDQYSLTPAEFCEKGNAFGFGGELVHLNRDEDWQALFDDDLKQAVATAKNILQKQQDERNEAERRANAIVLPNTQSKPKMDIEEIEIHLYQRHSSTLVHLTQKDGQYHLSGRALTSAEAAWVEAQLAACIANPDDTTWQSLPGGDTMSVTICRHDHPPISVDRGKPMHKYSDLQHQLKKLAIYGSLTEAEVKQQKS